MEKHVLDHLFKTFGRSTKGGDHQGMGTYIIQQLVEKADGTLDFTYRSPNLRLVIKILSPCHKKVHSYAPFLVLREDLIDLIDFLFC